MSYFNRILALAVACTALLFADSVKGMTMPDPTDARQRTAQLLARCHDDPDLFNTAILGRPPYWHRQVEMGQSVVRYRDTVAYTGNSLGKDYFVGGLVPWWLYTRHNSLVIVTGPSQTLLGTVTWKEIGRALEGARFPMGASITKGAKASPQLVRLPGTGWQALGYSTTNVERASGQHAGQLLVVVEEASGVEDEVWDAIDGLKYTRLFAIGNPIRADGRFVNMIRQADRDRADGIAPHLAVNAIRIPSTESPHAQLEHSPYGLADATWLASMARRYGPTSLWYRSHIGAEIPSVSVDQLLTADQVDFAATVMRTVPPRDRRAGKRRIGVDLGEGVGRDSTSIVLRDDLGVIDWIVGNTLGLPEAAERVAGLAMRWGVEHGDISYDGLGIGRDFPNHLARHGIRGAIRYAGSGEPRDPSQFVNIRTEAAWTFRRRLDRTWCPDPRYPAIVQQPFKLPPDPTLRAELLELTYDLVKKQTRLVSKKDLCDRLGHSPDRSDALIQTFAFC